MIKPFVEQIWRHPIKSLGAERVKRVTLSEGKTLPWDRVWALTYKNSKFDFGNPKWVPCHKFLRCSIAPLFAAVSAKVNESCGEISLKHPAIGSINLNPEDPNSVSDFIKWVYPICPKNAPKPETLCKVPGRGMTDTDYPSISLNSISSLKDLSKKMDLELDPRRFRGNIWIKGLGPWFENELVGERISIGESVLKVVEPIVRCNATKLNVKTGRADADTLTALQDNFNHKDFGVYCKVIKPGSISEKDSFSVIS